MTSYVIFPVSNEIERRLPWNEQARMGSRVFPPFIVRNSAFILMSYKGMGLPAPLVKEKLGSVGWVLIPAAASSSIVFEGEGPPPNGCGSSITRTSNPWLAASSSARMTFLSVRIYLQPDGLMRAPDSTGYYLLAIIRFNEDAYALYS